MSALPAGPVRPRPSSAIGPWMVLALLGLMATALTVWMWRDWERNADLSHGMLMPVTFLLLVHQARSQGPHRYLRTGLASGLASALLGGGLLAVGAAGLYASAVGWSHALVSLALCTALSLFLAAGWIVLAGQGVRWIGANWIAGVAIGLWLLCTPLPPGTYQRVSLGLQLWVTETVLTTLHLLGIPALRHGNILQLAQVTVGVEEACSGIRSLVSCLFAALLLSALLVRRPIVRALLLVVAAPIALAMNFVRSLALTLLANAGVDIGGIWHDATGFAVLGLTTAILAGIAVFLDRPGTPPPGTRPEPGPLPGPGPAIVAGGLLLAGGLVAAFALATKPAERLPKPPPDLLGLLPADPAGWQVATANLYEFSGTLQTEHLAQRQYLRRTEEGVTEVTLYVAYWAPGQAPVSLVATHTPDACWPGAGWRRLAVTPERAELAMGDRILFPAEYRVFEAGAQRRQVWFWHLHDGRPLFHRDPYSPVALLRIAAEHGFRRPGEQLFIRISSNRTWEEISGAEPVKAFLAQTARLGL